MSGHREPKPGKVLYPFVRLAEAMGATEAAASRALGLSGSTMQHYRTHGVSEKVADRLAVKAGLHPFEVWPEMVEIELGKIMSDRAKKVNAAERRRYRTNPQKRARRLEMSARWRTEYRDYKRAQDAYYYKQHAERERARRRARYAANREQEKARMRAYRARLRAEKLSHESAMVA